MVCYIFFGMFILTMTFFSFAHVSSHVLYMSILLFCDQCISIVFVFFGLIFDLVLVFSSLP